MLALYDAPGSSSMASHIALEEAGEHRTEACLRITPRGKVPALRLDDGSVLVENLAIQAHVARLHPEPRLLPADPADPVGEARALSLMAFFASAVHPAFSHHFAPARFTADPAGEDGVRRRGLETFLRHCREIDAMLAGRTWLLDAYSVADGYAFVFYGWGLRAGLAMAELGHFTAHHDRMLARPAVQRVIAREGLAVA